MSDITLRDYFAAHIAQGILAGGWADTVPLDDVEHAQQLAGFAYAAADAMLEAGKEKGMSVHDRKSGPSGGDW